MSNFVSDDQVLFNKRQSRVRFNFQKYDQNSHEEIDQNVFQNEYHVKRSKSFQDINNPYLFLQIQDMKEFQRVQKTNHINEKGETKLNRESRSYRNMNQQQIIQYAKPPRQALTALNRTKNSVISIIMEESRSRGSATPEENRSITDIQNKIVNNDIDDGEEQTEGGEFITKKSEKLLYFKTKNWQEEDDFDYSNILLFDKNQKLKGQY